MLVLTNAPQNFLGMNECKANYRTIPLTDQLRKNLYHLQTAVSLRLMPAEVSFVSCSSVYTAVLIITYQAGATDTIYTNLHLQFVVINLCPIRPVWHSPLWVHWSTASLTLQVNRQRHLVWAACPGPGVVSLALKSLTLSFSVPCPAELHQHNSSYPLHVNCQRTKHRAK